MWGLSTRFSVPGEVLGLPAQCLPMLGSSCLSPQPRQGLHRLLGYWASARSMCPGSRRVCRLTEPIAAVLGCL